MYYQLVDHSPGFLKIVHESKKKINETTVAEVKKRWERGDKFHLIDVREDNEWQKGHIRGAKHIGRGILERDIEKAIPDKHAEIVLYCGGGFRSALAADNLQKMGYANVLSMDGGWRGWTEANGPIEK